MPSLLARDSHSSAELYAVKILVCEKVLLNLRRLVAGVPGEEPSEWNPRRTPVRRSSAVIGTLCDFSEELQEKANDDRRWATDTKRLRDHCTIKGC